MSEGKPQNNATDYWHLDKRVPISLIVTIIFQTIIFVFWFGNFSAKTDQRLEYLEITIQDRATSISRISSLETKVNINSSKLDRIEDKLDRVIERQFNPD